MPVKKKDLVGQRFARWVVIGEGEDYVYPSGKKSFRWICKCDCGEEGLVHGSHLKNGTSQSCGCFNREQSSTHGLSQTRAYKAYGHMKRRCSENASPKDKELYFDRGIGVCERWQDAVLFFQDMGECPDGFELERLDPTKGYYPENCVWADENTQAQNRGRFKNNTSGKTGVMWDKTREKWRVFLYHKKVKYEGGFFFDFDAAVQKRLEMELEIIGFNKD